MDITIPRVFDLLPFDHRTVLAAYFVTMEQYWHPATLFQNIVFHLNIRSSLSIVLSAAHSGQETLLDVFFIGHIEYNMFVSPGR